MSVFVSHEPQSVYQEAIAEYGIVFCTTGKEFIVAQRLERDISGLSALCPVKLRYRRMGGLSQEEKVILFPGYVFIRVIEEVDVKRISQVQDVFRLLYVDTEKKDWHLFGQDRTITVEFFRIGGIIGFSKAYFDEGDRIHILDGFLKDHEGQIIRVNKRAKTVEVRVEIVGKVINMWLGYEIINVI